MRILFRLMVGAMLATGAAGCIAAESAQVDPGPKTETTREAILGGTAETGYEAVGALVTSWGSTFCTGTLFADRWVITAAHCVVDAPSGYEFMTGPSETASSRRYWAVEQHWVHPSYSTTTYNNDVAIVQLRTAPPIAPIPILDDLGTRRGELLAVGYGITSWGGPGAGVKRSGRIRIGNVQTRSLTFEFGGVNTCSGDSGGPSLLLEGGAAYVVGIHNVVYEPYCENGGRDMRADAYDDFVTGIVGSVPDTTPPPEEPPPPPPAEEPPAEEPPAEEPPPATEGNLLDRSGALARGEQHSFSVVAPGAGTMIVTMAPTGDVDLYASGRGPATASSWDCRPYYGADRAEQCAFTSAGPGTLYLMVDGYTAGTYTLTVEFTSR